MRGYESVSTAVMSIYNEIAGEFDAREAHGTLPIRKDRKTIAELTYTLKTESGTRRKLLDYSMRPFNSMATMEQSLGILVKVADASSPPKYLHFDARNIEEREKRDFHISSGKSVKCSFDVRSCDETVRLAAALLGSKPKELGRLIDKAAAEHNRRMPRDMGLMHISQPLYGNTGFVKVVYWMGSGTDRKVFDQQLSGDAYASLSNATIARELVKAFGRDEWRCHSDGTMSESEEDSPRLVVSPFVGPSAIFRRCRGHGGSRLHAVPEIVNNNKENPEETKIFDQILAEYEPFVKKE